MPFGRGFIGAGDSPWYTGASGSATPDVPVLTACSIGTHPYVIDVAKFERSTVEALRPSLDQAPEPGEVSLNNEGLWRRSQSDWSKGSNQRYFDEVDSSRARFWQSKGIDPFPVSPSQAHTLRLQKDVQTVRTPVSSAGGLWALGSYLYTIDGTELYWASTLNGASTVWNPAGFNTATAPKLAAPASPALATATTGGSIPASTTRYYAVTALNANGETLATTAISVTTGASTATNSNTFSWAAVTGATSYSWYAGTSASNLTRQGNVTTLSVVDGAATPATGPAPPSTNTATTGPGVALGTVTTDGTYVYASAGASGIYRGTLGGSTAAQFNTYSHTVNFIGYAVGRLLAGCDGSSLREVNASGVFGGDTGGSGLLNYTHPNPGFLWNGVQSTPHGIFVTGNSGAQGEMFRCDTDNTTGALNAPQSMFILPNGETLNDLVYYSGAVIIATSRGVRAATVQVSFVITATYGPVILVNDGIGGVKRLAAYGQFAYLEWFNYDTASTGLGKLDLAHFATDLTPALATDLMAPAQGRINGIAVFGGTRVFSVAGGTVYSEHPTNYVASGTFTTGRILFGTTEPKLPVNVTMLHDPLPAGASVAVAATDEYGVTHAQAASNQPGTIHPAGDLVVGLTAQMEQVELTFTITNGTDLTKPPVLRRWTLLSLVTPRRVDKILVPIKLHRSNASGIGDQADVSIDPLAEFLYLQDLRTAGQPVLLRIGNLSELVYISTIDLKGTGFDQVDNSFIEGDLMVTCVTVEVGN